MQEPWPHFAFGPWAPGAKNTLICLHEFRLHEKIAEDWMSRIRRRNGKDHFGVTRQFDEALRMGMIRKGHASQLDVILSRNADFRAGLQVTLALVILGARPRKNNF